MEAYGSGASVRHERAFLALSTTPFASSRIGTAGIAWPLLFEALLTLAAIAALLPLFRSLANNVEGRDGRFTRDPIAVNGLPSAVLPSVCDSVGVLAEPFVAARLCAGINDAVDRPPIDRVPAPLVDASARARAAFEAPLAGAHARIVELQLQQRQGGDDLLRIGNAIEAAQVEVRPLIERYAIDAAYSPLPLPLACANDLIAASLLARRSARIEEGADAARANALLLLAAAFDGDGRAGALAAQALLPDAPRTVRRPCAGLPLGDALAQASALMGEARHASQNSAKNEAMRVLLRFAGWHWAAGMVLGLVLLNLSRRRNFAVAGVALALAAWSVAAWAARVPWPFASDRAFVPARDGVLLTGVPAPFVLVIAALAALAAIVAIATRRTLRSSPQTIATRIGYPGFVFATGIGWLLLLDLSANANPSNRYLALYHQGHLWFAMLLLTLVAFMRQPLGRTLAWSLSMLDALVAGIGRRLGAMPGAAAGVLATLALIVAFGALLVNLRQVTSELGRIWLMVGAAWFFFLRGAPFAERLARSGTSWVSLVRYVMPLAFVVAVLVGAMVLTRDMGPLLIAAYAAGAFIAASASMWLHQRYGATRAAHALAGAIFIGWIAVVTLTLFRVGAIDDVTAARLENLAAPLASANDQLALVTWFQRASPAAGYGIGAVPWCGFGASTSCAGVPGQIQSDYTFTALVGAFGASAAWVVTLGCGIWLHRLVRHHGRATRGEPRFVALSGRMVNDEQALLSWLGVTWVVLTLCQLAVTVAGNLAVIPLTGVTFPFVSFGMTSLLVNAAMLALCLNVNVPRRAR
jgi:cell division protein FtsW (lipid II flippase)